MRHPSSQSGVAIFYILLAVALFAALGFVFTQSVGNVNTNALTEEEAKVYAQDVLAYANRLDRGVQRVMTRGICSENTISFYLSTNTDLVAYQHTPEVDDTCKVFHERGGTISWQAPSPEVNDGSNWIFTGHNRIAEVESDITGTGNDLIALLPNVDRQLCIELNGLLGITNPANMPPVENDDVLTTAYTGTFGSTTYLQTSGNELDGRTTGCFEANEINGVSASGRYYVYHVLLAR